MRVKQRATKNFKWTHVKSLENMSLLAYWLYISDETKDALAVCQFLTQAQYDGNQHHWFWIQSTLILQSHILKKEMSVQKSDECLNRVRSVGDNTYRLGGLMLNRYERNVNDALNDATNFSKLNEMNWRMMVVLELLFLIEMNVLSEMPTLVEKLTFNICRLRSLAEM